MADVVLFHPRLGFWDFSKTKPNLPLNLLCAAKYVCQDYDVKLIDQRVDLNWRSTLTGELKKSPLCCGSTSMTGEPLKYVLEAARITKKEGIPFVIGGPHATLLPRQTAESELVDYVVMQEGEVTFHELVKSLDREKPPADVEGIAYFDSGKYVQTPPRKFIDLNETPPIPYELVDVRNYLATYHGEPTLNIETSRGCPNSCTFCYNKMFHNCRWRSMTAENAFELIREAVEEHGVKSFFIVDDNLFVDFGRIEEMSQRIIEAGYDLSMEVQGANIELILKGGKRFLDVLSKAGFDVLRLGIETGSPKMHKMLNKKATLEQFVKANKLLTHYPITPKYNFMIGFPHETEDDLRKTTGLIIRLLDENPKARIAFIGCYTPYPGSEMWEESVRLGFKPPEKLGDWVDYDWDTSNLPWLSENNKRMLRRIAMLGDLLDGKVDDIATYRFIRFATKFYRPVARYRVKNLNFNLMIEDGLALTVKRSMEYLTKTGL